jgi:hypothetical protein
MRYGISSPNVGDYAHARDLVELAHEAGTLGEVACVAVGPYAPLACKRVPMVEGHRQR